MTKLSLSEELNLINRFRNNVPVDVEGLAFALGVPVYYQALPDDVSGVIEPDSRGGFRININDSHPRTRQRFTIAHELGHYIRHRHLIGAGIGDNRAYRSADTGKYANSSIGLNEETEANSFAATVLMPFELIERLKREGHNDPSAIGRRLEVSDQAIHIRMKVPYEPHPRML